MPTYLYCVLPPAGAELPAQLPAGVGGTSVRALLAGPVAAWAETVTDRVFTPTIERVRAHDAVNAAALDTGMTPLPARFGQTFEADDECREALHAAAARLRADLERVQGLVEMRLLIALAVPAVPEAGPEPETPGRAYMQRLLRDRGTEQIVQARAASVRERLSQIVKPLARDEAFVVTTSPTSLLTVSHLVARDDVPEYRASLAGIDAGAEVGRLVICGPVAPYQFVSPPA